MKTAVASVANAVPIRRVPPIQRLARPSSWHFEILSLLLCLAGPYIIPPRALQVGFTPLTVGIAFCLLRISPARYLRFTLLLWFFAPFFRRFVDLHAGYRDQSLMLLAPPLVSSMGMFFLPRGFAAFLRRKNLPFVLILVVLSYAFVIGVLQNGPHFAAVDLLRWLPPVLFALYCLNMEDNELAAIFARTFIFALIVMGLYSLYQNSTVPSWDLYWLLNINDTSFGNATQGTIRVFGTMNSPGPFAATLSAGLLLLFGFRHKLAIYAQFAAAIALVLTEVRSAWMGAVFGMLLIFWAANNRVRVRLVGAIALAAICITLMIALSPNNEKLSRRFDTFSSMKQDESLNERLAGMERAIPRALKDPFGGGWATWIRVSSRMPTAVAPNLESTIAESWNSW